MLRPPALATPRATTRAHTPRTRVVAVAGLLVAAVLAVVAVLAPGPGSGRADALAAPAALAAVSPHPPDGADWLATVNWWRSFGGAADGSGALPPVQRSDAPGPQHQLDYLAGVWGAGSTYCGHDQDPARPRPSGDYTHSVLACGMVDVGAAVDAWVDTPYHAPPLLSPTTTAVAAASVSASGRSASAALAIGGGTVDRIYTWPAPGGTLPGTTMTVDEAPDPTAVCPIVGDRPAQPVFAWFPSTQVLVGATLTDAAGEVPACVLGAPGAPALQPGGTAAEFTLFGRRPLTPGGTVTASLTTVDVADGSTSTLTWSFLAVGAPGALTASFAPGAGAITVTSDAAASTDLAASGGAPLIEWQLVLYAATLGLTGEPSLRLPVPGPGRQTVTVPAGEYWACLRARNVLTWSACTEFARVSVADPPPGAAPTSAGFVAVDPVRLLDTRAPDAPVRRLAAGAVGVLDLRGRVPGGAVAVALNVAAVGATGPGWVRLFPCTAATPQTSSLNPDGRTVTTAAVVVKVGDGRICMQSLTPVDLVVDLDGWLTTGSTAGLDTSGATRVLDTRTVPGGRLGRGGTVAVQVVAPTSGAVGVALSVTAVDPGEDGFVTAWPCGSPRPFVANLNPTAGVTRPNLVNVRVGVGGQVCLYSTGATDLVVDLLGEFRPGAAARFVAIDPTRVADSRVSRLGAAASGDDLVATGDVVAVQGVITSVSPPADGYLSAYPCLSRPWPGTANVTVRARTTAGNAALIAASGGFTCIRDTAGGDVVVDATGLWRVV